MLRKIAEIKVPKGAGPREVKTKHIFATYDKQGAAFAFYFSDSNIAGATANLLFVVDGQKVFVDDGVTLSKTNETHTFTYPLPDKLLNYTGKVDGYLYFDFEDGSHSDEIHFIFTIKKSQIDEEMEDAPDVYIKSFEEIKAGVQSKADQAKKDMQNNVDQVKKDFNSWKTQQEKKQEDFETTTDEKVSNVTERVGEAENKASDLEKHLDVGQKNYFSVTAWRNKDDWTITNGRIQAIKINLEGNNKYTLSTNIPKSGNNDDVFFATGDKNTVNTPSDGVSVDNPRTITTKNDGIVILAIRDKDMSSSDWQIMLNKGEEAYRWVPHTDDVATQKYIDNLYEKEVLYDSKGIYFEDSQSFTIDQNKTVDKLVFWWSRYEVGEGPRNYSWDTTTVDGDMLRELQATNATMRVVLKPKENSATSFKNITFTKSGVKGSEKNTMKIEPTEDNRYMVLRKLYVVYLNEA